MSVLTSIAIGRLVDDPDLRKINGKDGEISVCEFSLAVNYGFGDNEKTEFVNCVAWRKLADIIAQHCKKGRKIYVSGHQQTRHYDVEKEGVSFRQYKTEWIIEEMEFCDSAQGDGGQKSESSAPATQSGNKRGPAPF